MAEPYDPSEARLFPNSSSSGAARLSARDGKLAYSLFSRLTAELLPPYRKGSRTNSLTDDPYASSPQAPDQAPNPQMQKIKDTQVEIEAVKQQLHENIQSIHERGENLDNLQNKTGERDCAAVRGNAGADVR